MLYRSGIWDVFAQLVKSSRKLRKAVFLLSKKKKEIRKRKKEEETLVTLYFKVSLLHITCTYYYNKYVYVYFAHCLLYSL